MKILNYTKKIKKEIMIGCSFILVSLFIQFLTVCDFTELQSLNQNEIDTIDISYESLDYYNCDYIDKKVVTKNDDPYFIATVNKYVGYVLIELNEPVKEQWNCTYYWSNAEHGFDDMFVKTKWISGNTKSILIYINDNVESLRVDLGEASNVSFQISDLVVNPRVIDYCKGIFSQIKIIKIFLVALMMLLTYLFVDCKDKNKLYEYLFRNRYVIGAVVILLSTIFKIHGSSFGGLFQFGMPGFDDNNLWGHYRLIRTDEYVVFTEMALAQAKDKFNWMSNIWGYSLKDMAIVFGQPIKNIITFYRPFQLGFLALGPERGLAFYWTSRNILGFLISFEFGRIITRDDRKLSIAYAFLIIFAPIVQWWYSVNSVVELVVFGELFIVLFYHYFFTQNVLNKLLCVVGMIMSAGGYIITFYPRWMYPLFYVFFAVFIAVCVENKAMIRFKYYDTVLCSAAAILLVASGIYIYLQSKETIYALMNTYYPGKTKVFGGDIFFLPELFRGWGSYFLALSGEGNPCEQSSVFDFFPLGILLSIVVLKQKKDFWLISLNIANLLLIGYELGIYPQIIAKTTKLSDTSIGRCVFSIGLLNLILFFRVVSLYKEIKLNTSVAILIGFIVAGFTFIRFVGIMSNEYCIISGIIAIVLTIILNEFNYEGKYRVILCISIMISFIGGVMVNPIESGLDSLYQNPLLNRIQDINKKDEGAWAVCLDDNWALNNIPTIVGAKCVNATSVYPDKKMWSNLGLVENEELWNRYLHLSLQISEDDALSYELISADQVRLYIPVNDLKKIGVEYFITNREIPYSSEIVKVDELYGYRIYKYGK